MKALLVIQLGNQEPDFDSPRWTANQVALGDEISKTSTRTPQIRQENLHYSLEIDLRAPSVLRWFRVDA